MDASTASRPKGHRLAMLVTSASVAALSLIVGTGPVTPAAARPASSKSVQVPALGTKTVVVGDTSSMATVTLRKDATYSAVTGENPDFRFSGKGRFVGVLLVQAEAGLEKDGVSLFVGRYALCGATTCKPSDTRQFLIKRGTPEGERDNEGVLPAGDYRLILLTDGGNARVEMHLGGLGGRSTVRPRSSIETKILEPEPALTTPAQLAYADGGTYEFFGQKGFMFSVLSIEGDVMAGRRYGNCIYRGEPPLPPQVAYVLPECPGGLSIASIDTGSETSAFRVDYYAQTIFDPGAWGFGSFYQTAGLIRAARSLVVVADIPPFTR